MLETTSSGPVRPMNDFTVVVLEGAFAAGVAATLGILGAARKLAPRLGVPVPQWRLASVAGVALALQEGMSVRTDRLADGPAAVQAVWIVPGLGLDSPKAVQAQLGGDDAKAAAEALRWPTPFRGRC